MTPPAAAGMQRTPALACVLAHLADAELDALEHAAALEQVAVATSGDAEAYRLLAVSALGLLHDAGRRERALRRQLHALRDELARYTRRVVAAPQEAA